MGDYGFMRREILKSVCATPSSHGGLSKKVAICTEKRDLTRTQPFSNRDLRPEALQLWEVNVCCLSAPPPFWRLYAFFLCIPGWPAAGFVVQDNAELLLLLFSCFRLPGLGLQRASPGLVFSLWYFDATAQLTKASITTMSTTKRFWYFSPAKSHMQTEWAFYFYWAT